MIYGVNCSKCGTLNPANFRSNPTNYPQHKSRKKMIIGIIALSFVVLLIIPSIMVEMGIDLTSPEQKRQQEIDAHYQRMQDAQDEYALNPPNYVPIDPSCYDGKIDC